MNAKQESRNSTTLYLDCGAKVKIYETDKGFLILENLCTNRVFSTPIKVPDQSILIKFKKERT